MKKNIAKKIVCSMLVLSPMISGISVVQGAELNQTDIKNEMNAQLDNENFASQLISDGLYTIGTYVRPDNVFEVERTIERHVVSNPSNNLESQQWEIKYDSSRNAYQIMTKDTLPGQVLAWNRYNDKHANDVFCTPNMNYDEHYWTIEKASDNVCYVIRNYADSDYVLDLTHFSPDSGTRIGIVKKHDNSSPYAPAQFFHFNKIK